MYVIRYKCNFRDIFFRAMQSVKQLYLRHYDKKW